MNLLALVGPTAVGKTAVGVALAHLLHAEVVSADAVAVYRGLNIGAAKPTADEQRRARFHLIDVAHPDEDFTVADFERLATAAFDEIRARERFPLLVGGTGLYIRSVTATLNIPSVAPQVGFRAELQRIADADGGAETLHARLATVDAASAAKILPGDARRIIRALEVLHVTGQPMSSFHTPEGVQGVPRAGVAVVGLTMERGDLYARIDARVGAMLAGGLADEVRGLLARGVSPDTKSMQSLGYRHMVAFLSGAVPHETAVEEMKRDTRRFARRQLMWFRGDARVRWVAVSPGEAAEDVAARVVEILQDDRITIQ